MKKNKCVSKFKISKRINKKSKQNNKKNVKNKTIKKNNIIRKNSKKKGGAAKVKKLELDYSKITTDLSRNKEAKNLDSLDVFLKLERIELYLEEIYKKHFFYNYKSLRLNQNDTLLRKEEIYKLGFTSAYIYYYDKKIYLILVEYFYAHKQYFILKLINNKLVFEELKGTERSRLIKNPTFITHTETQGNKYNIFYCATDRGYRPTFKDLYSFAIAREVNTQKHKSIKVFAVIGNEIKMIEEKKPVTDTIPYLKEHMSTDFPKKLSINNYYNDFCEYQITRMPIKKLEHNFVESVLEPFFVRNPKSSISTIYSFTKSSKCFFSHGA